MSLDIGELLGKRGDQVYDLHGRYINPQFVKVLRTIKFDRAYVRGEGAYLYDAEGRRYLDLLAGYGTFNLGRNHPKVKEAIRQVLELDLPNLVKMDSARLSGFLAEELAQRAPEGLDRVFFANSGAEAVEGAIKFVRAWARKPAILYWDHGFHGLTMGALAMNGNEEFRQGFGPHLPQVRPIPFNDLEALRAELHRGDVAALFCEPIQGKGVNVPDRSFFREAQALLHQHGALLVMDEVQAGLGRTGYFLASEHFGVVPDVVTLAKALSGGMIPSGAVLLREDVHAATFNRMDRCIVHGSTFYQNDLAMAAGLATLQVMDEERLIENAAVLGGQLKQRLSDLKDKHPMIKEVRGEGLMLAIELGAPTGLLNRLKWNLVGKLEKGLFTQLVVMALLEKHGILSQVAGHKVDVLKMLPPLCITQEDVDWIVQALDATLSDVSVSGGVLEMGMNFGRQALSGKPSLTRG